VTAWLPRRVERRIAVARRRRSRMRVRTRPRTVARRRWGRWTGPPDAGPRAADQQHERGRSAGPVDDPRVGCVVSLAGSSCHPSLSLEVPPLVCCPSPTSAQHPMPHRRSRDCRSPLRMPAPTPAAPSALRHQGARRPAMQQHERRSVTFDNRHNCTSEGLLRSTQHAHGTTMSGTAAFRWSCGARSAVKESRLASDHLFFRHQRCWPPFARTGSPTTRAGQMA
jgi:hypothetical protein